MPNSTDPTPATVARLYEQADSLQRERKLRQQHHEAIREFDRNVRLNLAAATAQTDMLGGGALAAPACITDPRFASTTREQRTFEGLYERAAATLERYRARNRYTYADAMDDARAHAEALSEYLASESGRKRHCRAMYTSILAHHQWLAHPAQIYSTLLNESGVGLAERRHAQAIVDVAFAAVKPSAWPATTAFGNKLARRAAFERVSYYISDSMTAEELAHAYLAAIEAVQKLMTEHLYTPADAKRDTLARIDEHLAMLDAAAHKHYAIKGAAESMLQGNIAIGCSNTLLEETRHLFNDDELVHAEHIAAAYVPTVHPFDSAVTEAGVATLHCRFVEIVRYVTKRIAQWRVEDRA